MKWTIALIVLVGCSDPAGVSDVQGTYQLVSYRGSALPAALSPQSRILSGTLTLTRVQGTQANNYAQLSFTRAGVVETTASNGAKTVATSTVAGFAFLNGSGITYSRSDATQIVAGRVEGDRVTYEFYEYEK